MATYTAIDEEAQIALSQRLRALGLGSLQKVVGIPAGSVNSNYRLETRRLATRPGQKHDADLDETETTATYREMPRALDDTPPDIARYFLRLYEEQDRAGAESEARLLQHLYKEGVPTPAPMTWHIEDPDVPVIELAGKPASLFPWIDGEMRCQKSVTAEDARVVGAALAHVHLSGAGIEEEIGAGRFRIADLHTRLDRVRAAADPELARQADPIEARLKRAVGLRDAHLPSGLVHGDLFRDNVLWQAPGPVDGGAPRIAALLDFESASHGIWAYDLAVTVLAWTFGDGFDDDLARAMIAGYDATRAITPAERRGFAAECVVAALRFTITRITDYAMRAHEGGHDRVQKDWRRFDARAHAIEAMFAELESRWMPRRR